MTTKPALIFNNFTQFNYDINKYKNAIGMDSKYSVRKEESEKKYVQYFINKLKDDCKKLNYDTNFDKMVDDFNNFYENYLDDLPNDYLTLQNFTCMVSDILKNLTDNIIDFSNSYDFSFSKLNEIYDPTIPFDVKLQHVKSALSSDFLSRTIFHYENKIKYLSQGVNGGVNLISVQNGANKFNVIEKYMLDNSDPVANLFELLREYIIGTQLLFNVRPFTPNFTTVYGMYIGNDSVPYELNKTAINEYLKRKDRYLKDTVNEYEKYGYFNKNGEMSIANINTSKQRLYMMTEYSKGVSFDVYLKEVIRKDNAYVVFDVINILAQIFRSLIFAHNKIGYVHNDLHTGNILIHEQKKLCYLPEIINIPLLHNSQMVSYVAQIIDFGYSSITNYVNYAYFIYSDDKTTVHTDILRLYTSIMKNLINIRNQGYKNSTLLTIAKFITVLIGSYYFEEYKNDDFTFGYNYYNSVLDNYVKSGLYSNFEYLSPQMNNKIRSAGLQSGVDFYKYFIEKIQSGPMNLYEKIGFSKIPDNELYDYIKLEKRKSYIPLNDLNIDDLLNNLQPTGLDTSQTRIIKRSFVDFSQLCKEVEVAYNTIPDLKEKIDVIVYLCHNIINFSKYIALNTFLILYTKTTNRIPSELNNIFNNDLKNLFALTLALYDELDSSTLPDDYKDMNLKVLADFNEYFVF
jgi:hypothetical protein